MFIGHEEMSKIAREAQAADLDLPPTGRGPVPGVFVFDALDEALRSNERLLEKLNYISEHIQGPSLCIVDAAISDAKDVEKMLRHMRPKES